MPTTQKQQNTVLLLLLGAALGVASFLIVYGVSPLDVGNDIWIRYGYDESDVRQHYAGWLAFRSSSWRLPLAQADCIGYPYAAGVNVAFSDAMPILSIFFKLFVAWQPATFQWFGLYELAVFALQGAAAALLLGLFFTSLLAIGAGTLLFTFSPVMLERAFRHVSLSSHYFVVFALYFYLRGRREGRCFKGAFWLLAAVSVGITPYFLPMVAFFALLLAVENFWRSRKPLQPALLLGGTCAAGVGNALLLGTLGNGYSSSRDGYGFYSMNLNAVFNPDSLGGYTWSHLLPKRAQLYGQYDGFNYLGLGVLALLVVVVVVSAVAAVKSPRCRAGLARTLYRNAFLLVMLALLTLFAASNVLCFDDHELLTIPLPQFVLSLCGIFRASSRLFWPVYYTAMLGGLVWLQRALGRWLHKEALVPLAVAAVAAVQLLDMTGVIAEKHAYMTETAARQDPTPAALAERIGDYDVVMMATDMNYMRNILCTVLKYDVKTNGRDTNTATAAMVETELWAIAQTDAVDNGTLDPTMLYVTRDPERFTKWQELYADHADFVTWDQQAAGTEEWAEIDLFMLPKQ